MGLFGRLSGTDTAWVNKLKSDNKKMRKALDDTYVFEKNMVEDVNAVSLLIQSYLNGKDKDEKLLKRAVQILSEYATIDSSLN